MHYPNIVEGRFLERLNRFIARVWIDGTEELCHVKNTGRLGELLVPGSSVFLQDCGVRDGRKTRYSLITVEKDDQYFNIDSQAPNRVVKEWLPSGRLFPELTELKPEVRHGASRFDFYLDLSGKPAFLEVKGVTLLEDGIARFPDAPTQRGVRHIEELSRCRLEGCGAYLLFVLQMKGARWLEPNWKTHKAFGEALIEAEQKGVGIRAVDCRIGPDTMDIDNFIPVKLDGREA